MKGSRTRWVSSWGPVRGMRLRRSGLDRRPLGGRAAVQPHLATLGTPALRPALGRILPELLPAVDGPIQQSVRRCHHFVAPAAGPIGLEDLATVSEIARQDAEVPVSNQPVREVRWHRVPGNGVAHELAMPRGLLVRSLTEDRVADVA